MKIQVTEHKSNGVLSAVDRAVRVFVDNDLHYGYFVPEHQLFALLSVEQQQDYLRSNTSHLDVSPEVAQKIIDMGITPYAKKTVI